MRIAKIRKKPILDIHPACIGDNNDIQKNKDNDKLVVLLSGSPRRIYHDIFRYYMEEMMFKLQDSDTFIVASPVLPGTEK